MNVYLPIINKTLVSSASIEESNFYLQPIPVWPTRPYTITITPEDPTKDVEISILQGGADKFLKTIPYSPKIEFDLSIAGTVLNPLTRDQSLVNGGGSDLGLLTIRHYSKFCMLILFNADISVHMMPALGGRKFKFPIKPRIPGQPYDIIMPSLPWEDNGLANYDITCEPVDDYHGPHAFPTKYYLGSTIDIRYIKKLTVKSPNTSDTVAVAEYENKLPEVVENDDQMICAARLRWNMRNGQWFWYAFKDYFWNEGFTYRRGLGGASEQGILTINVAYAKEFYPAFQELLVSSNIELTLPKQFPTVAEEQRYKMEVTSDTGARWSGSERVYRQQITLRTIGFMDNYIPPAEPDAPAIIPVKFTVTPYEHTYPYFADINEVINVISNVKWDLVPQVDWLFPVSPADGKGTIGFTPVSTRRTMNLSTVRRVGYIHFFKAGTTEQIGGIKVNQNGAPAVNAAPKFLSITPQGGETNSFSVNCATAGVGTLKVTNMSGANGVWVNLDASQLEQDGGDVYVNPAINLPESGGVPRSCIIRTTHDITGQMADVNVMQSVACPVDRYPNDFKWEGKGMYAYDGKAHNDKEFTFTSGIPYTDMVGECDEAFISKIRIVRVEPNARLVFNVAENSGTGANVDRFARIRVKHVPTGKILGTVVIFQRAYNNAPTNYVYASWDAVEAGEGNTHCFDLITAASMVPSLTPPSQAKTHNIDSLNVNGVQLNRFRVMLDWSLVTRTIHISANVTGVSGNIPIIQYANANAMTISSNQIWHRLDPVWVLSAPNERLAEIAVQAQKLNQRDEISFFRLDSWVSLESTTIDPNNEYVRKFNLQIAANTTGAARGTEIRFQRPGISDIIIRIEQAG